MLLQLDPVQRGGNHQEQRAVADALDQGAQKLGGKGGRGGQQQSQLYSTLEKSRRFRASRLMKKLPTP